MKAACALMPSAFALFASAPPASAGQGAVASGGQDGETADLFSSKLADAFQGLAQAKAEKTDTPARPAGRLSPPPVSAADLNAAEADTTPVVVAEVETAILAEATPTEVDPAKTEASETEPSDIALAALPVAVPTTAPPPPPQPVAPTAEGDAAQDAVSASSPVADTGPQPPVPDMFVAPQVDEGVATAGPKNTAPATGGVAALPPVPEFVPTAVTAVDPTSAPIMAPQAGGASTAAAPASESASQALETAAASLSVAASAASAQVVPDDLPRPPVDATLSAKEAADAVARPGPAAPPPIAASAPPAPSVAAAQAASTPSGSAGAPIDAAQSLIDAAAPASQVQVTARSTPAAPTAPQAAAPVLTSPFVIAEAVQATAAPTGAATDDAQEAVLVEPESVSDAPAPSPKQVATAAPQQGLTTAATISQPASGQGAPSLNLASNRQSVEPGAVEASESAATASGPAATTHVAMADASRTRPDSLVQTAQTAAVDTPVDPLAAPLDPLATAEAPAEARALDGATTTAQTAASSLSRATVETTAQLAAQIARKLEGRSTRFDMVLTPEDLGRVDVSLEIGSDGQLAARLAFDNPAAAADLRGRADELRRQLQDAGFQVSSDSLDFTQRDDSSGGGGFDRQQQRQSVFAGAARLNAQAELPATPPPGAWTNHSQTRDRVDVRV